MREERKEAAVTRHLQTTESLLFIKWTHFGDAAYLNLSEARENATVKKEEKLNVQSSCKFQRMIRDESD